MSIKFYKMHGTGNDFVLIDCVKQSLNESTLPDLARKICDRHFGVGADQLLLVHPSKKADFRFQIFNSDGSEAEMCGNGIRCFAKYAIDHGIVPTTTSSLQIDTLAGLRTVTPTYKNKLVDGAQVTMGVPRLDPADIPVSLDPAIAASRGPILKYAIQPGDFRLFLTFVSMGNPHAVTFIDQPVSEFPLHNIGPLIERHPMFPQRVNFEIVNVVDDTHLIARVWERGSGETMACGTGACAIAVASKLLGLTQDKVDITLPGGTLNISWDGETEVLMEGPAEEVFTGEWKK